MQVFQRISVLVALALAAGSVMAQNNELNWTMDRAVKQLDRQGDDFESLLAEVDFDWSGGTQDADDISGGRLYMNRDGEFRISTDDESGLTILLDGRTVYYYRPSAKTVDEYSLSRHKDRLEPYVSLGFSVTGRDLQDDFLVTFIGEKTIGDRRALGIELTPERDSEREVVSRIELWFDQASWMPAQQVLSQAGGRATLTISYSGMSRNLDLNPDLFRAKWPRGTERERK